MKIVNTRNIPEALFKYLSQDSYDYSAKGDSLSATEILNPTRVVVLKRKYGEELVMEAADRLWQMLGNGVHAILEKEKGIEKIERLKWVIEGREISGKWDRIINNQITDYKVTSAISVMYKSREKEWKEQLSIYRFLYFKNKGILLDSKGFIVALLRDWNEKELKNSKYPKENAVQIELKLMSIEDTEKFLSEKVLAIIKAEGLDDVALPECSDEERWWNDYKKVYNRCEKYCDVNKYCNQYQETLAHIKETK